MCKERFRMFLGDASVITRSNASIQHPLKIFCLSARNLGTRNQEETMQGNIMQD